MAVKGKKIDGFIADMKVFQQRVLPKTFVAFQKYIALELYKRIMQKTPVDMGTLRGSWTISVGSQDRMPANKDSDAKDFEGEYAGQRLTRAERASFKSAVAGMQELQIGQIVWINNAMPYVLRIEFDGHSHTKAPAGMVNISIQELRSYLQTIKKDFVKVYDKGEI
jgi:hypothetical protein